MAENEVGDVGGHDVSLVYALPDKYKCPFCMLLMRDAIQTYRGEMACDSCYRNAKGSSNICPIDEEPIEDTEFFNDMHARREILQLPCYCSYKKNGCAWEGVVNDMKDHCPGCAYKEISCTKCHDLVLQKDIDHHENEVCRFRSLPCHYCEGVFDAQTLEEHLPSCHLKPMDCPYQCEQIISFQDLFAHVQNCPKVTSGIICPFQIVGCKHEPRNNADLMDHLQIASNVHAAFTVSLVLTLQQSNEKMKQDLLTEQTIRVELAKKVETQEHEKVMLATEMEKIQGQLNDVQQECIASQERCESGVAKVNDDLKEIDLHIQDGSLQVIDKKLSEMDLKYTEFEGKLKARAPETGAAGSGVSSDDIEQGVAKIDQLESGSAVLSANFSDLELKLQLLENTSYEGRQLWKVDNVAYRMNQAVTGKVTALHSAPCFQRRGGYKFCSRLYLNGDGMGRGTHVSLFFVVMKSEYDALLKWPFAQRVTFRLINPYNTDESIQESFIPDQNSSSFKRPTKDMNIAAGCPMFIRKENVQQFIIDDVLYIETSISSDILQ